MNQRQQILLFFLISIGFWGFSQNPKLFFKHITTKEGLPHKYMHYSILRDSKGFIWFGSEVGLHRYDGKEFTNYYNSSTDTTSFAGRTAFCIIEDDEKKIWIASNNGIDIFNSGTNSFNHALFLDPLDSTRFTENDYSLYIYQTKNKNILVSKPDDLYEFDKKRKIFVSFSKKHNLKKPLNIRAIQHIFEDTDGILWLSTQENGVFAFDIKTEKIVAYNNENQKPFKTLSNNVVAVKEDKYGEIWVGSSMGLNRINKSSGKNSEYTHNPLIAKGIPNPFVSSICEDNERRLWISTDGGGIALYDRDNDCFTHFSHRNDDPSSLMNDKISELYIDKDNQIWAASVGFGINYTDLKNLNTFHTLSHESSNNNSLAYNVVTAITEDESGNIWIGTDGGGLDYYDRKAKTFTHYIHKKKDSQSLPSNSVVSLLYDSKNILWVGTYYGGFSMFDKANNNFVNYLPDPHKPNSLKGFSVFAIKEDINGKILLGGHESGFSIFDREQKKFSQFWWNPNDSNSIASNYCLSIFTDSKGLVWIGTYNGLSCWDQHSNNFINYTHNKSVKYSISNNWIYCIMEDSKQNLWVGTAAGLNKFNRDTRQFQVYNKNNGFSSDVINGIVEDSKGNLWISTLEGIIKFNPTTEEVKTFDNSKGLPGNEFMKCAYYKSRSGEIFFGNTNGLVSFFPDSIKPNLSLPAVYITDFQINNKPVPIGQSNSPLNKHISETDKIVLKHNKTFITFKYIALDFESPEKNQYAYILEGFDKDWHYVDNETKATYSSLEPGEYTFKVKGASKDGVWNEKGDEVLIIVLPPWWKTWWFRTLAILLIASAIYMFYYLRLAFYRHQQVVLTKRVNEKTRSLEETTASLIESQEEILQQKEELIAQRDNLEKTNSVLIHQKQKISEQNIELDKHQNKLEKLVEERTIALEKALLKAEESDNLKSSFLKNMSHEIRTPLNAIVGFTSIILESEFNDHEKTMFGKMLASSIASLTKVIDDVLDISKIISDDLTLYYNPLDVNSLIDETALNLKESINCTPQVGLDITTSFPILYTNNNPLIIQGDHLRLKQIIDNLTDNALKYTEKGSIEIGFDIIDGAEKKLRIFVKDTGIGIQEEHQKVIFDNFIKIETDPHKLYRGIGLGLTLSLRLANLMGGKLEVESKLGSGSVFSLIIPLTENSETYFKDQKQLTTDISDENWSDYSVLIVDDEFSNLYYAELILKPLGAKIFTAKNGLSAIEIYKKEKPNVVLMDIKMPGINGIQALHAIRKINSNAIVIAQTAFGMTYESKSLLKEGFDNVLTKPFSKAELLNVTHSALYTTKH